MSHHHRRSGECARCGKTGELRGRGLDAACWMAAKSDGTLADFPLRNRSMAETAEEYVFLRSCGESHEQIAARLGRKPASLWDTVIQASKAGLIERPAPWRTGRPGRPKRSV